MGNGTKRNAEPVAEAQTNTIGLDCFVNKHKPNVHYAYKEDVRTANDYFGRMVPSFDTMDDTLYPIRVYLRCGSPVAWNDAEECEGFIL